MNTFKLLIPSLYELYSIISLFLITFFFLFSGSLITKNKNLICNFCVGWSLFNLVYLISTIILKIDLDKTLCLYIVILIIFLIKYFNKYYIPKIKILIFYFMLPLFLILINTKTYGYDSFAYILDRFLFLLENNRFPIKEDSIFRSNYTFTSLLVYYFANYPFEIFIENIPAFFDFILLFITSLMFLSIFKENNFCSKFFVPFSFLLVFFNPMIMNVYSYTSYEDFHVSFVLFAIYFFIFKNKKELFNLKNKDLFSLGLLMSLLSVSKTSGIIHSVSLIIGLFFFIFVLNKNKNKMINLILLVFFSFSAFALWNYHLTINDIQSKITFYGFRNEVLSNFLPNYYLQFLEKKNLLIFNLIFLVIPFFSYFFKNILKISYDMILFIFLPLFIWNVFLIFFEVFIQSESHALNLHNYFRFISQYSIVFTFLILIILIDLKIFFFKNFNLRLKRFYHLICIFFIIITFMNLKKIRRDLDYQDLNSRFILYNYHVNQKAIPQTNNKYQFVFFRFYKKNIFKKNFKLNHFIY